MQPPDQFGGGTGWQHRPVRVPALEPAISGSAGPSWPDEAGQGPVPQPRPATDDPAAAGAAAGAQAGPPAGGGKASGGQAGGWTRWERKPVSSSKLGMREWVRTAIAVGFSLWLLLVLILGYLASTTGHWKNSSDWFQAALPATVSLLGSALGFYYGERRQK